MQDVLEKARNDLELIKDVMKNTSDSIASLSKTFILLGFLFLCVGMINLLSHYFVGMLPGKLYLAFAICFVLSIVTGIAIIISKALKTPQAGLAKRIIKIWIWIFVFQVIAGILSNAVMPKVFHMTSDNYHLASALSLLLESFAFLCVGVFSNHKIFNYFAVIFAVCSLYFFLPNPLTSVSFLASHLEYMHAANTINALSSYLLPVTFLISGYYLKNKKARGN